MGAPFDHYGIVRLSCLMAVLFSAGVSRAEDGYGDLTGQFVLDGDVPARKQIIVKGQNTLDAAVCAANDHFSEELVVDAATKGIANIFVYLPSKDAKSLRLPESLTESSEKDVVIEIRECHFRPHNLIVRTDQNVILRSLDPNSHVFHPLFIKNDPRNHGIAPKAKLSFKLPLAEPVPIPVKCDIHPWMQSHWLIVDHPWAAVTDKEGKFKIPQLPEGEHAFRVWHERCGYVIREWKVKVTIAGTTAEPVKVALSKLQASP